MATKTTSVTSTAIAVALAVIIALAFLFFGSAVFTPLSPSTSAPSTADSEPVAPDAAAPTTRMITDTHLGTGAEAVPGKTVTVNYVGTLPDGTVFDASERHGQPFTFTLGAGQVIAGWDQGIAGMKVGGKRHLVIPPELGYGAQAVGSIPANATLIFDVELLEVK